MNNAAYWKKRFRQLESARHASDGKKYLECEELFTAALRELDELINAWFGRFARNNAVTLEDARKLLTKSELAELKWDVKQYIKAGEANALTGEFEKQLENASAKYHISRLEAIKLQVQMECEKLYGNLTDEIDDHIQAQYLDAYYHTAYEIDKGFGVGHTLETINTDKLESIVSKPWAADGKNFATRLGESKVKLINNVHASLTQMCMNGNNPDKAIAQLAKTMNGDKVRAGRIIMTESAYFAQEAQRKCFSELGVEEYEIVATLDNRTCDGTCQGEDGKHYPMKMFEAGVTAPPFHPNCRCCTAPYFNDDDGERIAKDVAGKNYTVSSDMTYPQWKKEFVNNTKITKLENNSIISGGTAGARNPYGDKAREHAERYYAAVRKMKTDVARIAETTGRSLEEIQEIKDFIFMDEHDLLGGRQRFEPDYMMAESWRRLIEGKPEPHDLTLINHELMERGLMAHGVPQDEAHIITTQTYNYDAEATEYYAKIKKFRKE